MFDWIKDLVVWLRDELKFWVIINHYDRGVRLRLGKHRGGVLTPGIHWRLPVIDEVATVMIKPTTLDLTEQTVTTRNSVQVVIECSVKYEIVDAVIVLLEVHSAVDALADMSKGIIRKIITSHDWPQLNDSALEVEVLKELKKESRKWGIRVVAFNIATLAPMRSIRLLQTSSYKLNETNN